MTAVTYDIIKNAYRQVSYRMGCDFMEEYHGHAMFGRPCLGVCFDNMCDLAAFAAHLVTDLMEDGLTLNEAIRWLPSSHDSMGAGYVFYNTSTPHLKKKTEMPACT